MSKEATHQEVRDWLSKQVAEYRKQYASYKRFAALLKQVLERAAGEWAPLAIIQAREKSIASFAEKALRKRSKYDDPVNQLTDLCGGRVIARTRSEVNAFCDYIKRNFEVDDANSLDTSKRLTPSEFGYRSIHYIVKFRRDGEYGVEIPDEVFSLKAEVQVRTLVEHAYADFGHDLTYKGAFKLPTAWQRELASVAAALEEVDQTFSRIEDRLKNYTTSYGKFMSPEERQRETDMLEIILEHVPEDVRLAAQLGKLAIVQEDWDKAIAVLSAFVDPKDPGKAPQPMLRDLGVALCKKHPPGSDEYTEGQNYLEIASAPKYADVDAMCSLAGTWKGIDEQKVRDYYLRAFETDPHDAYALENFLEGELRQGTRVIEIARPLIKSAAERCESHIAAGINIPWAFYSLGKFHLLLGEPHKSLDAYAKAVHASSAEWMIGTSRRSLERLSKVAPGLRGYQWVHRLLLLGSAIRFASAEAIKQVRALSTPGCPAIKAPVRIVAGATDPKIEKEIQGYRDLLVAALSGYTGTIISGGTIQGVSGLVGDAKKACGDRIHTIGYLPGRGLESVEDATVDEDPGRYTELRYTDSEGFTPLEPLQYWIDLTASNIPADKVRLVGISGGRIAAAEYRIALALGAAVGIISASGREAEKILSDTYWSASEFLTDVPRDTQTVRSFFD